VPRWDNASQAHSRVSNINFDIWKKILEEVSKYPIETPLHNCFKISKLIFDALLWA
jgi:hypothetical protein